MAELSYGQKAVGLKFNPSEGDAHDKVAHAKQTCADLIDLVEGGRTPNDSRLLNSLRTAATMALVTAQMAVVKVITWTE